MIPPPSGQSDRSPFVFTIQRKNPSVSFVPLICIRTFATSKGRLTTLWDRPCCVRWSSAFILRFLSYRNGSSNCVHMQLAARRRNCGICGNAHTHKNRRRWQGRCDSSIQPKETTRSNQWRDCRKQRSGRILHVCFQRVKRKPDDDRETTSTPSSKQVLFVHRITSSSSAPAP